MTTTTHGSGIGGISGRLIVAVIVAVVALVGYFGATQINPVTQEEQHISMTPEQEIALGKQAAPEMEQQFGGLSQDQALQAKVTEIGNAVVKTSDASKSPYQYEFHVLADQNTVNAFALPGGQVFVTEALILDDEPPVPADVPRDATDTRILSLAAASDADYLVTNDRRHLLRLKQFGRTRIVTPHRFLQDVSGSRPARGANS